MGMFVSRFATWLFGFAAVSALAGTLAHVVARLVLGVVLPVAVIAITSEAFRG